jgi:hypothetical protein
MITWAARGEQATLDERILADQRIAVSRLAEHRDVGVASATGELARELVADALHHLISMLTPSASQWVLQS